MVEIHDLRCRYGDFEAVHGVDLCLRPGELIALLGTNGAGKTTTMETIAGHRRPQAGHARVLGRDPYRHRRALAHRIGVVFQDNGLPADLTVIEALHVWLRLHQRAGVASVIDEVLQLVALDHRRTVRYRQLSGGERRRLDLALALVTRPEVLLLDEPTTGMDPEARWRTWRLIERLNTAGVTILLTTHSLEEAERLARRVVIMHEGRIVIDATPAELAARWGSTIRCRMPGVIRCEDLPELSGDVELRPATAATRLSMRTREPQDDLRRLLAWADAHAVKLDDLALRGTSLADVFRRITQTDEVDSWAH